MARHHSEKHPDPKKWFEITIAIAALVMSAVSLWVAVGTEDANRKMVSAASWPLIQFTSSDAELETHRQVLTLTVNNAGVGPAKLESFELFYKGRAIHGTDDLMRTCCGYVRPAALFDRPLTSTVPNTVLRAGETRSFLIYARTDANAAVYDRLDDARRSQIFARACYCSVFDECWISDDRANTILQPKPVKTCPVPPISYRD